MENDANLLSTSEIQLLPEFIANQIAAGEVVQRPESVVKELVENSLDAGATSIAVVVRNAGKQLIHVIDNGKGISPADLPLALKRHATSKIKTSEDLHRILTLGFRGEALASIAAVAQIEIRSRRAASASNSTSSSASNSTSNPESALGWKLISEPLQEPVLEPCAMDAGTQVFVRNLFYNVPARRKFLRSDLTEFRHIADTMLRFALGYPQTRFVLYDNDALIYDLQPATTRQRIADALSMRFADELLEVEFYDTLNVPGNASRNASGNASGDTTELSVTGFVGQPHFAKKSKSEQFLYLNGRTISSRQLSHAVVSAYEHLLDQSSYPPYVLFLTIDESRVDVNIHPQKHEVKFDDDRTMYAAIRRAVAAALARHNITPQASFREASGGNVDTNFDTNTLGGLPAERLRIAPPSQSGSQSGSQSDFDNLMLVNRSTGEIIERRNGERGSGERELVPKFPSAERRFMSNSEVDNYRSLFGEQSGKDSGAQARNSTGASTGAASQVSNTDDLFTEQHGAISVDGAATQAQSFTSPTLHSTLHPTRFLWQLHKKYILLQNHRGMVMIDQHAAHERILYERALRAMNEGFAYGQELLFPVRIQLTASEAALAQEVQDELEKMGFRFTLAHTENIVKGEITSVPADVRNGQEEAALRELLEQYRDYAEIRHTSQRDNLAASFGCRSAIRAGDALTIQEMRQLVDDLYASSMPYACPHGRPIIIEFPLEEFDRRFGRTS